MNAPGRSPGVPVPVPAWAHELPDGRDVWTPMRDGTRLAATVWLPAPHGRHPVLLARTPYGRAPYGPGLRLDVARLLSAGYAVMVQDVRGTGESEGDLRFLTGEAADGHDTVTWTARQPWCDGQVGMFGDSYLGIAQLLAASERPDGLRAIAPSVCPAGLHDVVYAGGVPRLGVILPVLAAVMAPLHLARRARLHASEASLAARLGELLRRLPVEDQPEITALFPFYADWLAHPDPSHELWRETDLEARYDRIEVPALLSTGWYDYFRDSTIRTYHALRDRARLVVGPWSHALRERTLAGRDYGDQASGEAVDWTGLHLDWFGHWMRGTPLRDDAKVRVFVTGACEWRTMAGWPPENETVRYHLGDGGSLGPEAALRACFLSDPDDPVPTMGGGVVEFLPPGPGPVDQRPLAGRSDVLRHTTGPLPAPLEVMGAAELVVTVESDARSFTVTGKLVDVHPDGREEILVDGIARVADGATQLPDGATRLTGGGVQLADGAAQVADGGTELTGGGAQPETARVLLGNLAHVFGAGHRVRVEVAGSNFPKFARHAAPARITISAPSYLLLPVTGRPRSSRDAVRPRS
ncbi:CocE/NonD family hydrolase [Microbispora hainanensis]|uniref:CocE/NonD family hydrolase n=1 Tax=Microbispora TaxID=2005 RepID=UPI0011C9D6BD|nr:MULTISPECIES: CocE/NonD family hydrolase [Microbispora]